MCWHPFVSGSSLLGSDISNEFADFDTAWRACFLAFDSSVLLFLQFLVNHWSSAARSDFISVLLHTPSRIGFKSQQTTPDRDGSRNLEIWEGCTTS